MQAKDKIIVAIDTSDLDYACELVEKLYPYVGGFKFGLELGQSIFKQMLVPKSIDARHNLELLRELFSLAKGKIFWDGKFCDIPSTVSGASRETVEMGVKFFTVHVSSGIEVIKKAAQNKDNAKLLAVTVLTSLDFVELWNVGFGRCVNPNCQKYYTTEWQDKYVENLVELMTMKSRANGADGIVCSPQELKILSTHKQFGPFLKVTPSIRPVWAPKNDQKRVMTPSEAIMHGADYLVIGRPITDPPPEIGTPVQAAELIVKEIKQALEDKDA